MPPQTEQIRGRWLIYSAPAVLIALALCSVLMFRRSEETRTNLWFIERIRMLTARTLLSLTDAETGQRGYLLTGDTSYLVPYYAGRDSIPLQLATLNRMTFDQLKQRAYMQQLVPIVERRLARLDSEIVARRSGDAAKAVGTVSFGNGKQLMDSARVLFGLIRREEGGQLALLEERDVKDRRRLQFALVLGALFTTLVSFYATTTLANDATRQWLMSAELHARIDMLRGQVPGRISGETRERSTPTSNQTSN